VSVRTKAFLWDKLQKTFKFPRGTKAKVEHYSLKSLGEAFRRWRSCLNKEYVQDHSRTMGGVCGPEDNGSGIGRKCQVHGTGEEEHPSSSPGYAGKEAHFWKLEEDAQASRTYTMQGVVVHAGGIRC
jgi:hypothetical protein